MTPEVEETYVMSPEDKRVASVDVGNSAHTPTSEGMANPKEVSAVPVVARSKLIITADHKGVVDVM